MIATPTFPDFSALVVDESLYIRRIVRDMLMRVGIKRVLEAPDGAEALGVLAESKPDLTIIDWDLAILSGEEFIRLARTPSTSPCPTIPIILMLAQPRRNVDRPRDRARCQRDHRQAVLAQDPVVAPGRGDQSAPPLFAGEEPAAPDLARGKPRQGDGLIRVTIAGHEVGGSACGCAKVSARRAREAVGPSAAVTIARTSTDAVPGSAQGTLQFAAERVGSNPNDGRAFRRGQGWESAATPMRDESGATAPARPKGEPPAGAGAGEHIPGVMHRPVRRNAYAALDLGTNNCRLLIAEPSSHGFRVIDAFSRIVRLGEGLGSSDRLSEAAIERTIEALRVCKGQDARPRRRTG